jgi:phospholipase/carboxylesterase
MRARPLGFAFTIVLSGFVIDGDRSGDAELERVRPPVFWGRGLHDPVISDDRIEQTSAWLPSHSTLEEKTYDTGHSMTEGELANVSAFVEAHFPHG